ncbi:MAG: pyruvate dehydrogenase complex dihydrolipoamide acetyltransferase [Proteobacteria bacterium]|nr:pyruvate dehydrogenase complex dihydrolipoamide acetyltransferase [Pseudomonadota bacterium]
MPIEVLMPALSPTMKEGNLAKWLKKEGDSIEAGDVIAEIETDKATMEVEAVDEGVLGKVIINEGTENVAVNSVIALILEEGEDKSALDSYKVKEADVAKADDKKEEVKEGVVESKTQSITQSQNIAPQTQSAASGRVYASPLAKRIAGENNLNIASISGTGPRGRVIKDDVLEFMKSSGPSFGASGVVNRNPQEFTAIKNNNVRKVIARRLLESKQTIPHFYLSCDIKLDKLLEMRASLNEAAATDGNGKPIYKISVNDLVIKAVALALKAVPAANSSWSDEAVLIYNNVDISVAVAVDDGLITPIVRNADQKSVIAISSEMKQLIKKAKDGKLQPEEFQGGGFSISNLGMYGIDSFQAIVNPPQSCILAVGAGIKKPIVENCHVKTATVMNVTLSSDHRCVDGAVGAQFIQAFKKVIENPITMLIS